MQMLQPDKPRARKPGAAGQTRTPSRPLARRGRAPSRRRVGGSRPGGRTRGLLGGRPLWTSVERQVAGVCLLAVAIIGMAGYLWDATGPVGRALAYWGILFAGSGSPAVWVLAAYLAAGLVFPRWRLASGRRSLGLSLLLLMLLFGLQLGLGVNSRLPAELTWQDEIAGLPTYGDFLSNGPASGAAGHAGAAGTGVGLGGGIVGAFFALFALRLLWRVGSYVFLAAGLTSGLLLALGPGGRRAIAGWLHRAWNWIGEAFGELKDGFLGEASDLAGTAERKGGKPAKAGNGRAASTGDVEDAVHVHDFRGDAEVVFGEESEAGAAVAGPDSAGRRAPRAGMPATSATTVGHGDAGAAGTGVTAQRVNTADADRVVTGRREAGGTGMIEQPGPYSQGGQGGQSGLGSLGSQGGEVGRGGQGGHGEPSMRSGETRDRVGERSDSAQLSLLADNHLYRLPPISLLARGRPAAPKRAPEPDQSDLLIRTLATFGIEARVINVDHGPVVTRYELQPAPGIKVSRILSLSDDIALALAAAGVRIEAPIPGKSAIGIEVPNREVAVVHLREVLESGAFQNNYAKLLLGLGKDIAGQPVVADLARMPHLLIAGATGSGKSVCMNTLIASVLFRARPDDVKLMLVDPKRVELTVYDGVPHLVAPVVTEPRRAAAALRSMVEEMENRYRLFAAAGVRNIEKYNEYVALPPETDRDPDSSADQGAVLPLRENAGMTGREPSAARSSPAAPPRPLPYIVVFIDELADLMMVAAADVEDAICRLAQMARAAGIHLVIATQRPSVDVITGLIKANVPSRIAFAVSSQVDSRTILDHGGAELLLGRGDMLFLPAGAAKARRVQGAYITDREVEELVEFWKTQGAPEFLGSVAHPEENPVDDEPDDALFEDAVKLIVDTGQASVSLIQRRFRVGYARAARLIDMMEVRGIVGPYQGSKPREVLIEKDDANEGA